MNEVSVSQQLARRVTVTSCTIRKAVDFSTTARRQTVS
jgi:NADH/NAD ratio-sensing transcriptional regulator Rex